MDKRGWGVSYVARPMYKAQGDFSIDIGPQKCDLYTGTYSILNGICVKDLYYLVGIGWKDQDELNANHVKNSIGDFCERYRFVDRELCE